MTRIYYKNPQTNTLTALTYKDFNAASIWHTHTWKDIYKQQLKYDSINTNKIVDGDEIPQSLSIIRGGAVFDQSTTQTTDGIYAIKSGDREIKKIVAKNGVFGYFNGANNYPSFEIWPIVAGGTGATSPEETIQNFCGGITNLSNTTQTIDLRYKYSTDAYITTGKTDIVMSLYLPYQFLPNTTGILQYYTKFINQPGTTTAAEAHGTASYAYGFSANFRTDEPEGVTTNDCIYKYGWTVPTGTVSGTTGRIGSALGKVTVHAYGAQIKNNNNQLIYQDGSVLTVCMNFTQVFDDTFSNNTPVFIANGYACTDDYVPPLKSQIILPSKELIS